MPSNGKVAGRLIVSLDMESAGFYKSLTGADKAVRGLKGQLKDLQRTHRQMGASQQSYSQQIKASNELMKAQQERIKGVENQLSQMKKGTQQYQNRYMQLQNLRREYQRMEFNTEKLRKQELLHSDSVSKITNQYKQQAGIINATIQKYKSEGNELKVIQAQRAQIRNSVERNNALWREEANILKRVRAELGANSNEYVNQKTKLRLLEAETQRYNAELQKMRMQQKQAMVQQQMTNTSLGRGLIALQKNKSGLIDLRNSFMGLTAAAVGMAFPVAAAIGGAVKATIQWEDAVANVKKTTNASESQMKQYSRSIDEMAKKMPQSHTEIANTMALAAQLGVKNLKGFTKVATEMGVATNLTSEQAAEGMAKFANATGKPNSEFEKLGSTIVQLGNNMATQEDAILEFGKRLAGTGTIIGVSQKDILALSAAMSSVGISAEAGGSAMSKVMTKINNAVQEGGADLQGFAKIAGRSGKDFADIWKKDPYEAIKLFEEGLHKQNKEGHNVKNMLAELGIKELREVDTVLRLANGHEQLIKARQEANKGWEKGTALSDEAATKYETLGNQMKIFKNYIFALGKSIGATLAPALIAIMDALKPMIEAFINAPSFIKVMALALGAIPLVAVPVLGALAAITGALGLMGQAMQTASKSAMANSRSMKIYAATMQLLSNPIATTKKGLFGLGGMFTSTSQKATKAGTSMTTTFGQMSVNATKSQKLTSAFTALGGKLKWILSLGGLLLPVFKLIGVALGAILSPIGLLVAGIATLTAGFVYAYKKVDWFRNAIDGLLHLLKVFGGGILESIGNKIKQLGSWAANTAKNGFGKLSSSYKDWYNSLSKDDVLKKAPGWFDTLGKAGRGVAVVFGSMKSKATDVSDALGKGVSKQTENALRQFVKYSEESDAILTKAKNNHGKISEEEANKLLDIQKNTTENILSEIGKRAQEQEKIQREIFDKNSGLSAKREEEIITETKNKFETAKENIRKIGIEIDEFVRKAKADGKIDASEMKELNSLYDKQRKLSVGTLSSTHKEQERILAQMSSNRKAYNVKDLQSIVKSANKALETAKKKAKDEYDQEVDKINMMEGLSKEEKDKMLANAKKRYDESLEKAKKNHKDTLGEVKKNNKNIEDEMDLSNGKIYTNAEKLWNKTKDAIGTALNAVWKDAKNNGKMIGDFFKGIDDGINNAGAWLAETGGKIWEQIKKGWNRAITSTGDFFSSLGPAISYSWNNFVGTLGKWGELIWTAIKTGWNIAVSSTGDFFSSIGQSLSTSWETFKTSLYNYGSMIWQAIKFGWTNFISTSGNLWNDLLAVLGVAWEGVRLWFYNKGVAIAQTLVNAWNSMVSWVASIFNNIWNTVKFIWQGIWTTISYYAGLIGQKVIDSWNSIKYWTSVIFYGTLDIARNTWNVISGVISRAASWIWGRIQAVWSWIRNHTAYVFDAIWSKLSSIWSGIKGTISYWTGVIWDRIKSVWSWISERTRNIFNGIGRFLYDKWEWIRSTVIGKVQGMWDRVRGIFGNMNSGIKGFAGRIKDTITNMVSGIKGGLNKLIDGVNWVGGKLGIDKKIPKLHTGTEHTHTQNFVKNGAIAKPTLATVNDKGSGNGFGRNGHQEIIQKSDGRMIVPKGKDATVYLEKGDRVINGRDTQRLRKQNLIPKFASGTGRMRALDILGGGKKPKKQKKHDHIHGDVEVSKDSPWGFGAGGGAKDAATAVVENTKKALVSVGASAKNTAQAVGAGIAKGKKWLEDSVGEILDYIDNPSKLLDKVMEGFGVDFSMVKGEIPKMLWKGMWSGLKNAAKNTISTWLEDAGGGEGGWVDISKGINFPFSPHGHTPGYPFAGPHFGIDLNYNYEKLFSTHSGQATAKSGWNGGFGNSMWIKSGIWEIIYGHMSKLNWTGTRPVHPGTFLGISGNTGRSSGPHLHYEMRKNGVPQDPEPFLRSQVKRGGGGSKSPSAWSSTIRRAAAAMGESVSSSDVSRIVSLIKHESGGNAGITQSSSLRDINVLQGNPAKGLLQYIPQTFRHYAVRGHKNIYSGYDQLLAFFNNKYWRSQFSPYGGWSPSGPRKKYANGGLVTRHQIAQIGEGNKPEMVIPLTKKSRAMQLIEQAKAFMGIKDPELEVSKDININNNSGGGNLELLLTKLLAAQTQTNELLLALLNSSQNIEEKPLIIDESTIKKMHNKHQDERERKEKRIGMYRGGSTI